MYFRLACSTVWAEISFLVFERSLVSQSYNKQDCMHLFDQKYSRTVILWHIITILKSNLFLWWQSWIFSIITPVFSVTWSFRNHSNMLICCLRNIMCCLMLNIFLETTGKYDFAWSFMSTKLMIMIFPTLRLHKPRLSKLRSGRLKNYGRLFFIISSECWWCSMYRFCMYC